LIVHDDPRVRESLRDLLERRGPSMVGAASDGTSPFSMASSLESGLIVMDRMTPRMDGVEATRLIKATQTQTQVILLSAALTENVPPTAAARPRDPSHPLGSLEDRARGADVGADAYITRARSTTSG
jgi:two-component system response regulator MprA